MTNKQTFAIIAAILFAGSFAVIAPRAYDTLVQNNHDDSLHCSVFRYLDTVGSKDRNLRRYKNCSGY